MAKPSNQLGTAPILSQPILFGGITNICVYIYIYIIIFIFIFIIKGLAYQRYDYYSTAEWGQYATNHKCPTSRS